VAYFETAGLCPCGSGKPFKDCCQFIQSALGKKTFPSIAELNAGLDSIMRIRNSAAMDDFDGLSPEQMSRFLYYPFESSHLIEFSPEIQCTASPFMRLFLFLIEHCSESSGLKTTVNGNLPRALCRDAAIEYCREEENREQWRYSRITTETDFMELHTVRIVAVAAGFIKKARGRFMLTKSGKNIVNTGITGNTLIKLLMAYTRKFNWGYNDLYQELHIVQDSFLYTLFVLQKHGDVFRPSSFYADLFIKAFPGALQEVTETPFCSKEEEVRRCYILRSLERFACFWGFAERKKGQGPFAGRSFELKKTTLLDQMVSFHTGGK